MKIIAYLKPTCGWSKGVRAVLKKYDLSYEDKDIVNSPENYQDMVRKSGQSLSPCVMIDGVMLADVSGQEVEDYLLANEIVEANEREAEAPLDQACVNHPQDMQSKTIRFF